MHNIGKHDKDVETKLELLKSGRFNRGDNLTSQIQSLYA